MVHAILYAVAAHPAGYVPPAPIVLHSHSAVSERSRQQCVVRITSNHYKYYHLRRGNNKARLSCQTGKSITTSETEDTGDGHKLQSSFYVARIHQTQR